MKMVKYLLAIAAVFASITMLDMFSYAEDDVYVPSNQPASSDLGEVARDSSAFDGGSGSTINTSTQTPVEAYSSSVPDIGPSGPVEQQ